ncbi:MAG: hypothetical protein HW382_1114 [Deltaproteobacteria bacterium]|nr:hypothetical protein [Deltaproteobacteria bacterium]
MLNLLRLGRITGSPDLEEKADMLGRAFSMEVTNRPSAYTYLMVAADFAAGPSCEVVIAGDSGAEDTKAMIKAVNTTFIPNMTVLHRPTEQREPDITRIAPFTAAQNSIEGKATAYVCRNHSCGQPTTDIEELLKMMGVNTHPGIIPSKLSLT